MEKVFNKVSVKESGNDFKYWKKQSYVKRLETLEEIRKEYHRWKYDSQSRFQRVYKVVKR